MYLYTIFDAKIHQNNIKIRPKYDHAALCCSAQTTVLTFSFLTGQDVTERFEAVCGSVSVYFRLCACVCAAICVSMRDGCVTPKVLTFFVLGHRHSFSIRQGFDKDSEVARLEAELE